MKMPFFVLAVLPACLFGNALFAQEGKPSAVLPASGYDSCIRNENVSVRAEFNDSGDDMDAVSASLKAKTEEIKTLARAENFTKFAIQSSNYHIYFTNNSGSTRFHGDNRRQGQYRFRGSIGLSVQPAEKAFHFMKVLTDKGYRGGINVSNTSSGNCPQ